MVFLRSMMVLTIEGIEAIEHSWNKCIELKEDYVSMFFNFFFCIFFVKSSSVSIDWLSITKTCLDFYAEFEIAWVFLLLITILKTTSNLVTLNVFKVSTRDTIRSFDSSVIIHWFILLQQEYSIASKLKREETYFHFVLNLWRICETHYVTFTFIISIYYLIKVKNE